MYACVLTSSDCLYLLQSYICYGYCYLDLRIVTVCNADTDLSPITYDAGGVQGGTDQSYLTAHRTRWLRGGEEWQPSVTAFQSSSHLKDNPLPASKLVGKKDKKNRLQASVIVLRESSGRNPSSSLIISLSAL